MSKRPYFLAGAVMVLLALVLLNLPVKTAGRLKLGIGSLFVPVFGLITASRDATEGALNRLIPRSELIRQNEALLKETQTLKLQLLQSEGTARENDRLRKLLGWQPRKGW